MAEAVAEGSGVYTLLILLPANLETTVGSLGQLKFDRGIYAYTGSAHGEGSKPLAKRVSRHMNRRKKVYWHIDYLTTDSLSKILGVTYARTSKRLECSLNRALIGMNVAFKAVRRFGSTDCVEGCPGHLVYLGRLELSETHALLRRVYESLRLEAQFIDVSKP